MKRMLAAMLTALMLFAILPLVPTPAKAEYEPLDFTLACLVSSAYVGETFYWSVSSENGSGYYEYTFHVFKDGSLYAPETTRLGTSWRDYTPPAPGKYMVKAGVKDKASGQSVWKESAVITVLANPNKITKVEPVSATSLKITWSKMPGADNYYLLRSTDQINWHNTGTISNTTTSITDTNLKAGTRYFYKVGYAKFVPGILFTSWLSPAVVGMPMGKTRITSITSPSARRIRMTWAKAAGASGYQVAMATSSNGAYKPVRIITGGTTAIFSGVKSGTTLYFKVRPYRRIYTTTCWGQYSVYRSVRVK